MPTMVKGLSNIAHGRDLMTLIAVGGHSRKTGKTSAVCGIIRAFPDLLWTAVKVSSHHHANQLSDEPFLVEEQSNSADSDSSRYRAAGAQRAFWAQANPDRNDLEEMLAPVLMSSRCLIIESNAAFAKLQPDLSIMVVNWGVDEFKESAKTTLRHTHALLAVNWDSGPSHWKGVQDEMLSRIPLFPTNDPGVIPPKLFELIKSVLVKNN
jgi:hypothetical protein